MADRGTRVGARLIDAIVGVVLVVGALLVLGDGERPLAAMAIAWFVLACYEAATVTWFGATPGKLAVGLRVVGLDRTSHPPLAQAAKRAAVNAAFSVLAVVGWALWLSSTLTDTLGRGIADRAASTMVVPKVTALPIATRDLPGYADGARPPRRSHLGRVGDLDVRARARLRRLVDAPALAVAIGLLALAASLPVSTATLLIGSSVAWIVVFVVDETRRIARTGATAGHRLAGLVVLDRRTGAPPGLGR
ncbi:MAG TPA: RDD family protein, partial [Aquihabitans sp.]|nr:RDD family protein [Aquihabitans sp.]